MKPLKYYFNKSVSSQIFKPYSSKCFTRTSGTGPADPASTGPIKTHNLNV